MIVGDPTDKDIFVTAFGIAGGQRLSTVLESLNNGKAASGHTHPEYASRGLTTILASGTNQTLDVAGKSDFEILWTGNTVVSFDNVPTGVSEFQITGVQDGTGGRLPTFPDVDVWELGISPVIDTAPGATQSFVFYTPNGGTVWRGFHGQRIQKEEWSTQPGVDLVATQATNRFYFERPAKLISVRLTIATPPTGAAIFVDVERNGGSNNMFTTQSNRPSINPGSYNSSAATAVDSPLVAGGDYVTFTVDTVGSGTKGQGLQIMSRWLEA